MLKKISLLAVAVLFGISTIYFAQGQGMRRMTPEERTKQLTEQLKLDKDQAKKVQEIYQKSQQEMSKVFQNGGGFGDPATREQMMKLREETNDSIMKL